MKRIIIFILLFATSLFTAFGLDRLDTSSKENQNKGTLTVNIDTVYVKIESGHATIDAGYVTIKAKHVIINTTNKDVKEQMYLEEDMPVSTDTDILQLESAQNTSGIMIPTESLALINVFATNKNKQPLIDEKISFINNETSEEYFNYTDENGKFSILVPKGEYQFVVSTLGKDTVLRTFDIPKDNELRVIDYNYFFLPRTINLDRVYFDTNKSIIRPESFEMLNELAEYLRSKSFTYIEIAGHTDNEGDDESNLTLSQNRANAIRNYLIEKGIDSKRLKPIGYGESKPIATNETAEGRQKNRRTEVYIYE